MPAIHASFADAALIRLFRCWSASRAGGQPPLPAMTAITERIGLSITCAVAADSLFELVESHLGRPMKPAPEDARERAPDEAALLALVRQAPDLGPLAGSRAIPHGLPGAICWAASVLRDAMGEIDPLPAQAAAAATSHGHRPAPVASCPFAIAPNESQALGV